MSVLIHRDDKKAFLAKASGQLIVYDLGDNCIHHDMKEDSVDFLLVSSSGQLVVMATINGDISVIDTHSCKFVFLFEKNV